MKPKATSKMATFFCQIWSLCSSHKDFESSLHRSKYSGNLRVVTSLKFSLSITKCFSSNSNGRSSWITPKYNQFCRKGIMISGL